jgi:mRNA-degrading endonuclease toxin of MazEF toxin-antitoxin module
MAGGTSERRAHRRGSFHGEMARPEGNDGEGRRPVVVVDSSRFRKVTGARVVVGVASTEREGSR